MKTFEFEESHYYTGPDLTHGMVLQAQAQLGRQLPSSYIDVLRVRNGGIPRRRRFSTTFPTSWAPDHFEIAAIRGIGGTWGVNDPGPLSSPAMIETWGYPDIGVVVCDMPSGGHDAVMLDYRSGSLEPAVAYVDEDRLPRVVASSFAEFLERLEAVDSIRRT